MSVEAVQSSGNDHGFIFKRGRAHAVKALGARVNAPPIKLSSPFLQTPLANKRATDTHLDFPTSKRRLTTTDHTVLIDQPQPAQPTPLVARTRTKHSTPRRRTTQLRRNPRKSMRRRSTFSMRGKRASSIGGGFKAIPHDSVSTQDFYRHISPELPEPVRLRQLLAWCARRTAHAPEWPTELPEHVQKLLSDVYKEAADDVHSALERGEIATSWYHRPAEVEKTEAQVEVRAHPENVANAEARDTLVARIARLQQENDAWVRELRRAGTEHARVLDRLPSRVQTAVLTTRSEPITQMARPVEQIDWTPATQANEAAAQYVQTGAVDDELQETEAQIARATHELEVRLDAIHVDMHKAHESHKHARSTCARIRSDVGFVFDARRERAQAVATTRPVRKDHDPTRDLLRTLASALSS